MVFEAHCMSFPCTELLLFNYAKANRVLYSMAPLKKINLEMQYLEWISPCCALTCC